MPSAAEQKTFFSVGVFPAPDTPDLPSTTTCGSISPASTRGVSARIAAVA
jgi:hypothetical protein